MLAKERKAWSVAVNLGLVSKCQTHCYGEVLLWEMTKSREEPGQGPGLTFGLDDIMRLY